MELLRNRPFTHSPKPVAPGKGTGLRVALILMLGAMVICTTALAAPPGPKPAGAQAAQAPSGDYVGSEMCATCHQEVSDKFATNPHTRMALMHGKSGITCENCHGPGRAHVEGGGDVTKIFDPAKASAKEINARCETCHAGTHPDFDRSPHVKAGLSCTSCHDIHNATDTEQLLRAAQPTLCFQCHTDVKPSFSMPFHHPVNEGVVQCGDCHDVHGTFGNSNLKSTADQNLICTKCHTEVRGPFVYEHAPVKAEGCLGCHSPHGSQNARMLNMPNINTLCLQCHGQVATDTVHGLSTASTDSVPCTSCHTYIHGSNIDAAFIR